MWFVLCDHTHLVHSVVNYIKHNLNRFGLKGLSWYLKLYKITSECTAGFISERTHSVIHINILDQFSSEIKQQTASSQVQRESEALSILVLILN